MSEPAAATAEPVQHDTLLWFHVVPCTIHCMQTLVPTIAGGSALCSGMEMIFLPLCVEEENSLTLSCQPNRYKQEGEWGGQEVMNTIELSPLTEKMHAVAFHSSIHRELPQVTGMALLKLSKGDREHNSWMEQLHSYMLYVHGHMQ